MSVPCALQLPPAHTPRSREITYVNGKNWPTCCAESGNPSKGIVAPVKKIIGKKRIVEIRWVARPVGTTPANTKLSV